MQSHSRRESFSLKTNAETKADNTITPPETSGNCTDAGTDSAAIRCRKFPVWAAAPRADISSRGFFDRASRTAPALRSLEKRSSTSPKTAVTAQFCDIVTKLERI